MFVCEEYTIVIILTVHEQCCARMKYEFLPRKTIVFDLGRVLLSMCCFFSYVICISLPYQTAGDVGDKFYLILKGRTEIYVGKSGSNGESAGLECVKVLSDGMSFGEMALLKNQPRLARVMC